ncbi:hypothetical protein FQR65_LT08331 [Abscondita terminalis]|nr:hypothetical protein FQR65_LT08331 [Abscondita terminalis]
MNYKSLFICVIFGRSLGLVLRSYTQLCYRNDPNLNECLLEAFNNLQDEIKYGNSVLGSPSLDPLLLKNINVTQSFPDIHVTAFIHILFLFDMYNYKVIKVDYKENQLNLNIRFDSILMLKEYEIDGVLFNFRLKGKSVDQDRYSPVFAKVTIIKNTVLINGVEHCNILDVKFKLKMTIVEQKIGGLDVTSDGDPKQFLWDHRNEGTVMMAEILRSDTQLCYKNDPNLNNCLLEAFNNLRDEIRYGNPILGSPSLDPLSIKNLNFTQSLPGVKVTGFVHQLYLFDVYNYKVTKVDYTENQINLTFKLDKMPLLKEYEISGVLFNVNVKGKSVDEEVFSPVIAKVSITKNSVLKNGVEHCNIVDVKFNIESDIVEQKIRTMEAATDGGAKKFFWDYRKEGAFLTSDVLSKIFESLWKRYLTNLCSKVPLSVLLPSQ